MEMGIKTGIITVFRGDLTEEGIKYFCITPNDIPRSKKLLMLIVEYINGKIITITYVHSGITLTLDELNTLRNRKQMLNEL